MPESPKRKREPTPEPSTSSGIRRHSANPVAVSAKRKLDSADIADVSANPNDADPKLIAGASAAPGTNSFSVDIDLFSEECDIKIDNYRQAILEEPTIIWKFTNPKPNSSSPEEFKFEIKLRNDPISGNGSGRQPPRTMFNLDGTEPFSVSAKNLSGKDVKCTMAVKIVHEDGSMNMFRKEKGPTCRAHNASSTLHSLGRGSRFLTPQGSLILMIKMDICNGLVYESGVKKIKLDDKKAATFKTLSEDIQNMRNEEGFDDIRLECGNEAITCNKFLLCARSAVFRAMFYHSEMKEAKENKVVIEEAEASTVKDLIEFIYSDKVQNIDLERTVKLLPLAERYDIPSLSGFCREALATHLNVDHSPEVAMVADQHQLKELLDKAVAYMVQNSSRVIKTEGWKDLLQSCPEIANQIISTLSKFREDNIDTSGGISCDHLHHRSSRGTIRVHSPRYMFDDAAPLAFHGWPPPNNPEEEVIPQFQLDHNAGPNHVIDEWNPFFPE